VQDRRCKARWHNHAHGR